MALAAGAHHELANAALRVRFSVRILWREAFVVVLVCREDHVRSRLVESLPEWPHFRGAAVFFSGAEAWVVHVGQSAVLLVGGQIGLKPPNLPRENVAAGYLQAFVTVEGYHEPPAEIVGI